MINKARKNWDDKKRREKGKWFLKQTQTFLDDTLTTVHWTNVCMSLVPNMAVYQEQTLPVSLISTMKSGIYMTEARFRGQPTVERYYSRTAVSVPLNMTMQMLQVEGVETRYDCRNREVQIWLHAMNVSDYLVPQTPWYFLLTMTDFLHLKT